MTNLWINTRKSSSFFDLKLAGNSAPFSQPPSHGIRRHLFVVLSRKVVTFFLSYHTDPPLHV